MLQIEKKRQVSLFEFIYRTKKYFNYTIIF